VNDPEIITHPKPENVYAYAFNNGLVNEKNPFLKSITAMKIKAGKAYEDKYVNTERFIERHALKRP